MSLNYHERIKMLSNLAYSLCKKFEMNPYVVSLYPEKPEITIQGKHSSKIEEKLTREGYELIRQFESDNGQDLFKDFMKKIDNIEITFTLVINRLR